MKLHILRHAKTVQAVDSVRDYERSLLPKGIEQAKKTADYFLQSPDLNTTEIEVHCSGSLRTRQTLELISQKNDFSAFHFSDELYLASRETLLSCINQLKTSKSLLIIAHNDGLSDLVSYLSDEFVHLKTCAYVCLEAEIGSWAELSGKNTRIVAKYRPEVN